ncbi:uncharacterized protein H6S33_003184 [Morchella sextelata]|uniref:uncharacterized protein n=1 Tax=Morchella sextelata TaxID=1174677 RepID=UPI001D04579A|nr:uncharacterized protein H6S33_003184 [Morchella sextelata]KAH0607196.1 hypothetical protein H6S33_003184 [Morchella sextelata]
MSSRPYSTLHSPDAPFANPQASQYSLHTPVDPNNNNPFYSSMHPQEATQAPIGTQENDIPMKNYSGTDYPSPSGTPAPNYVSPSGTPAPGYPSPQGSVAPDYSGPSSSSQSPYVPLSNLPSFPPPPTSETHPGPATSPPPTHNLPPVPPEPAYNSRAAAAERPITPKTPIYTPSGASGPNGGVHAPGQIGHPNQQHGREEYQHGMCDCFSDIGTCCTGYWCPCILYSRTKHRVKTSPDSNINEFKAFNPHCMAFCALAPVAWVFTMLQRTRIREKYQLEGSIANDCGKAYCCGPCTLIQDEREVTKREDERSRFAGPSKDMNVGGYKKTQTMVYGRVDV